MDTGGARGVGGPACAGHAHLDLGLHLLGPGQLLRLGDGRGEKLGFKGGLGGVGDLLWLALSSYLLCGDLKRETPGSAQSRARRRPSRESTGAHPHVCSTWCCVLLTRVDLTPVWRTWHVRSDAE